MNSKNKSFISLYLRIKKQKCISVFLSFLMLWAIISCSYYSTRNVQTTKENITKTVKDFNQSKKYVIIHSDSSSWHLNDMVVNEDNQMLSGSILPIDEQHKYKKPREKKRVNRYSHSKNNPLNEIHFYLKTSSSFQNNQKVNIPMSDIASISVNDKNTGRAIANVMLGTVGTVFAALLIYAALKSSCPFVYIKNGEVYNFVGELYPGVITPNMQNDDYLPLPDFKSENGIYTLKVANYLKEVQHTDLVQLILVNHENNVEVLLDNDGRLQTISNLESPVKVTQDNDLDNLNSALKKDNDFYAFNTPIATKNNTRSVVFEFEKPKKSGQAKLYLTAKNSVWLDYIFGKFNEQFGQYYNKFQKDQQQIDGDSIKTWTKNQHIPLSVYKKTKTGWALIERVKTVGPMAMRDLVIPFNFDDGEDVLKIKLETGFMFWEVDYVGMDFSENIDLKPEYINPLKATDQNGIDVTHLLNKADNNYFTQPHIGDEVIVQFLSTENKQRMKQSAFLKNRGYYNYLRNYKGIPDFEKLKTFRTPSVFTNFSEEAYFDFVNYNPKVIAYHE
ncbi:hypothetical protein N1F78_09615 [Seonamhaeicola sp. MEBiC1930]|uniref:hypothetical protein n=1 Tax=Seonamhaeicola sp. MEBiC01930 TaxID=2976768 RepID=UPI003255F344